MNEYNVILIIPMKSILALRKAISSMKDVSSLITLCTREQKTLEISVLDTFQCSGMYTHIQVKAFTGAAWVNIQSEQLNALASALKAYTNPLVVTLVSKSHMTVFDANTKEQILGTFKSHADVPTPINPIRLIDYYFITMVSQDLLGILVNLSVGSAVMNIYLKSDGQLCFSNKHEYGSTVITKQLSGFALTKENDIAFELCKGRCVIKFIKQIVNHLVNCSKQQCVLGVPKSKEHPLVIKFLLSSDIYQQLLMLPYRTPLKHRIITGGSQNPLCMTLPEKRIV